MANFKLDRGQLRQNSISKYIHCSQTIGEKQVEDHQSELYLVFTTNE